MLLDTVSRALLTTGKINLGGIMTFLLFSL
jgi:hypothetical protein